MCEAVSKVLSSVTEALGTFIQEMAATDDSATASLRRSKRKRAVNHEEESAGPSLRRSKRNRIVDHHEDEEDTEEDPDYEEDELNYEDDEEPDTSSDNGSIGTDFEDEPDVSSDNESLDPDLEDAPDDAPDHRDTAGEEPSMDDSEDLVPLSSRLKRIQSGEYKDFAPLEVIAPDIPAQQAPTVKKLGNLESRHARLKLPKPPTRVDEVDKTNGNINCSIRDSAPAKDAVQPAISPNKPANTNAAASKQVDREIATAPANVQLQTASGAKVSSWDFPPPTFDIMESIEEPTPPVEITCRTLPKQAAETTPPTIHLDPPGMCYFTLSFHLFTYPSFCHVR